MQPGSISTFDSFIPTAASLEAIVARAGDRHAAEAIVFTNGNDLVQALIDAIRDTTSGWR
jgi:hypothetical protein